MKRAVMVMGIVCLMLALSATPLIAAPAEVSSADLVEESALWDGQTITFTGEAIGEAMRRGDLTWLHLNDDPYAVETVPEGAAPAGYNSGQAIIVPSSMAEAVTGFGDHDTRGDIVRVVGVFHAADPEYGGDMTIEAISLEVIERARSMDESVSGVKLYWMLGLALSTALAYAFLRSRKAGLGV